MGRDITTEEYKVYGANLNEYYSEMLKEKEEQLTMEKNKKKRHIKKPVEHMQNGSYLRH